MSLERADLDRIEGHIQHVSPTAASVTIAGTVDLRAYRLKRGSDTDRGGAA